MAFTFKIKIDGSAKPPIWRKVKVSETLTFNDFHLVIQKLFGWENGHLYQFSPKGWGSYPQITDKNGANEPFSSVKTFPYSENYDATKIKLNDYFKTPKQKIIYVYDFGDDWRHTIELEGITDEQLKHAVCLAGKGSNLTEDCGGIWGFYSMVEAVNDPKHPEHKEYREWLGMERGDKWDLNAFDLDLTNEALKKLKS